MTERHTEAQSGLDRSSGLPLFLQIRQRLLTEILNWQMEDRHFPSDQQLAERFHVSKMTIRQALANFVDQGLLERRRGRGTVVCDSRAVERLTPALDIDDQYRMSGFLIETQVLSVRDREAERAETRAFALADGEPVAEIKRLRSIGGVPVAFDYRIMPGTLGARCGFDAETAKESIIDRLRAHNHVSRVQWRLVAHTPDIAMAEYLQSAQDEPMLTRHLRYLDQNGNPVMTGATTQRSDRLACEVTIDLDETPSN